MKNLIPIISLLLFFTIGSINAANFDKDKEKSKKSCCSSKKEEKSCGQAEKKSCCSAKKDDSSCEKSSKKSKKCCTAKAETTKSTEELK